MIFTPTKIHGAYVIDIEPIEDERGFFARTWCLREFAEHGLHSSFVQCNLSYNRLRGTLRGMHYQIEPFAEVKIVSCNSGNIYDVILDLRTESPSYRQWEAVELSESNRRMLYIPAGVAHGFQTLQDDTHVYYQMSEFYAPECARGIRWDDPFFSIKWPIKEKIISEKDQTYSWWFR